MKKKNILILLVISILFCISSVKAEDTTNTLSCKYKTTKSIGFPEGMGIDFRYKSKDINEYYNYLAWPDYSPLDHDTTYIPIVADFSNYNAGDFKDYINDNLLNATNCPTGESSCQKCPEDIEVCIASKNGNEFYYVELWLIIFIKGESKGLLDTSKDTSVVVDGEKYYIDAGECVKYNHIGKGNTIENALVNTNETCDIFSSTLDKMLTLYSEKSYNEYDIEKEKLTNYCQNVLSMNDYSTESGVNGCVSNCLRVSKFISKIENPNVGEKTCGFSQRLIVWVGNIIKWIKYIIPVIVIVLGIIDFIKAIASSNDDEMKKAQGRFIKRLVAAALIFIIPFIIEFILDKTGFSEYVSGCGVIDL